MTLKEDTERCLVETEHEYCNLIKFEGTVVGSSLIMPTTECAYYAGAALLEPHRGQGLALASLKISIDSFIERENTRPTFYYWLYSDQGRPLALALRRYLAAMGLPFLERAQA